MKEIALYFKNQVLIEAFIKPNIIYVSAVFKLHKVKIYATILAAYK